MFTMSSVTSFLSVGALTGVTITGVLIVACIILLLVVMTNSGGNYSRTEGSVLPGLSGFSAIRLVMRIQKGAPKVLFNTARTYGNIFSLRVGGAPLCVITDYKLLEEAFVTNGDRFSDRGGILRVMEASIQLRGSMSTNGAAWEENREFVAETIKNQEFGRTCVAKCVNVSAEKMCRAMDAHLSQPFDPKPVFQTYVTDILHQVCFGDDINYLDPDVQKFIGTLDEIVVATLNPSFAVIVFPSLVKGCFYSGYRAKLQYVAQYMKDHAEMAKQNGQPDSNRTPSLVVLLAEYIRRIQSAGKATSAEEGDGWRMMLDFFFAGVDTVHQALMWCTLFLAAHTDVQEKVRQELSRVTVGEDGLSYDDRDKVPFTVATMLEILRMRPLAPMGVPHFASENGTVDGYNIKKGTQFMANLWAIQNNPDTWNQPDTFNPERFLDLNGELDEAKTKLVIPFSIGPRSCPGQQVARMTIFKTLTTLVQQYQLGLPAGAMPSFVDEKGSFTMVPDRFEVILSKV